MASLLPDSFRCFGCVEHVYARNLPRSVRVKDGDSGTAQGAVATTHGSFLVLKDFSSPDGRSLREDGLSAPTAFRPLVYRSELCTGTQHPTWNDFPLALSGPLGSCTAFTLELHCRCGSDTPAAEHGATEEEEARERSVPRVFYSQEEAERSMQGRCGTLVARIPVDTKQLRFVGASVAQADHAVSTSAAPPHLTLRQSDSPQDSRSGDRSASHEGVALPLLLHGDPGNDLCVYFKCADGVYALAAAEGGTRQQGQRGLEWSRSSAGRGVYDDAAGESSTAACPAASSEGQMTVGDVRALAVASLSWKYLREVTEARRNQQLSRIDAAVQERQPEGERGVAVAVAQAALTEAREALAGSTRKHERLLAAVADRQRLLARQEAALAALQAAQQRRSASEAEKADTAERRRQELARANLRSRLARTQQARVRELVKLFPITLSTQYGAPLRNTRNAKDSIADHALPVFLSDRGGGGGAHGGYGGGSTSGGDDGSGGHHRFTAPADRDVDMAASVAGLVATSADDLFEEANALGYVAHVVQTLSALYGCPLPHPLLVAGARSRVLVRADAPPEAAAAPVAGVGDDKLPLSCQRVAERPLLRAALRLVLRDCVVLARAMGKEESRVLSCGLRLGAVLQYLCEE